MFTCGSLFRVKAVGMSRKRAGTCPRLRRLRAVIDEQLTEAAEDIFSLLKERRRAEAEELREAVTERISAAVRNIFTEFEASRAAERGEQEPGERLELTE